MTDRTSKQQRGFWESVRYAFTTTMDTIGNAAATVDESVSVATEYVHNRAVEQSLTDRANIQRRTAEKLLEHKKKLQADPELEAVFKSLDDAF